MPWFSVKLPWGLEARLLNISSTGLLLESGTKLTPGSISELRLCGRDGELAVAACFVRSEIASVDHIGVKYHTAVSFEKPLRALEQRSLSRPVSSPITALGELLTQVSAALDRHSDLSARAALEQGIGYAVHAQDIQFRDVPIDPGEGSESTYFAVPTGLASPAVLQVRFANGYTPTDFEFKLLKAAAGLAAVVLEFDESR